MRAIHRIITEGLLLAVVKNPGIVVHDLHHSSPTVSLLNEAYPMSVQKMIRHPHMRRRRLMRRKCSASAEEAVTQI